jgi:D-sedoheptulose 7-phosphate isomerase
VNKRSATDVRLMLKERVDLFMRTGDMAPAIEEAAGALIACLEGNGTVWTCGNGGSAAQAQHFAAELVGRFKREREALRVVCLADNMATLTSVANDYEFADVFARQVRGMARRGDALLGFSTSGNSENVARACAAAQAQGVTVVSLTGESGGRVAAAADIAIRVPDSDTPHIQEVHLTVVHLLCDMIEGAFARDTGRPAPGAR